MTDPTSALRALGGNPDGGATGLPNIPAVPATADSSLNNILASMKLWMEKASGSGFTGFASKDELIRAGILRRNADGTITAGGGSLAIPPVPTGLTASGAMTTILLSWDDPTTAYDNHGYTEVWAAETDNFTNAVLIGQGAGFVFSHAVGEDSTRYYWIRFVSTSGIKGPYNSVNGTMGQTAHNPAYLLDTLTGQLTESQLYADLNSRIDLIDGAKDLTGSVNARIKATNDALQAQINDLTNTPAYDNAVTYTTGNIVQYSGGLYQAKSTTTGNLPTNTTYWTKIGDYTSLGAAVADNTAQIAAINTVTSGSSSAAAQAIVGLQSRVTTAEGNITSNATAISNTYTKAQTDSAISSASSTLTAAYQSADTATLGAAQTYADSAATGALNTAKSYADAGTSSESTARASADSALTTQVNTAYAAATKTRTYSQNTAPTSGMVEGDLWFDADDNFKAYRYSGTAWVATDDARIAGNAAAIQSEATTRANADTALASQITTLTSTVNTNNSTLTSAIQSEAITRANTDASLSTQINTVSARLNSGGDVANAIVQAQTTATTGVTNAATAQTTADSKVKTYSQASAPTSGMTTGDLWVDTDDNNHLYRWNGSFWADAHDARITATASSVTTLQTTVNGHTTSIQTQQTSIDGIQGKYAVKIDNNGYVSGFGLISTANNATPTSEFTVVADKFSIAPVASSPTAADGSPFYYITTPTVVNGVTIPAGAYMKTAYIHDAAITSAKISDLSADKINAGTLAAARIGTNSLTADKINGNSLAVINGTFSGNLQGATGSFSGALSGATGTFAGRLAAGVLDSSSFSGSTATYSSAGTFSVTVPNNSSWTAVSMRVTLVGAGGGGQQGWGNYSASGGAGAGGAAGSTVTGTFSNMTPGATLTLTVGAGGLGGGQSGNGAGYPGGTGPDGQPGLNGGTTTLSGYLSASGGVGGAKWLNQGVFTYPMGNTGGTASWQPGYAGANSSYAAGGAAGGVYTDGGSGVQGSGGGGGAASNYSPNDYQTLGGNGGAGYAIIEFFDPNFVVTNTRYSNLITWLDSIGHGTVPTNAR